MTSALGVKTKTSSAKRSTFKLRMNSPRLGVLLVLQQAADPGEGVLGAQFLVLQALLVFPVGRHAVLGHVVHLPGADLHLEGDALLTDDGGVEGTGTCWAWGVPM